MTESGRRTAWRFGVPLVCLLAGLLLAATHGVSGGDEIRVEDGFRDVVDCQGGDDFVANSDPIDVLRDC